MVAFAKLRKPSTSLSLLGLVAFLSVTASLKAQSPRETDLAHGEMLLRTGKYDECAKIAAAEMARGFWSERWAHLKIEADRARGRDQAALTTLETNVRRFPASLTLQWLAHDVYLDNNRPADATAALHTIEVLAESAPYRYGTPEGRVALGRYFLFKGADSRTVLDRFYDVATKQQPDYVDAYLATAELALQKQDNALAATTLEKAPKASADDPRYHVLLARAFSTDDRVRSTKAIDDALKINADNADALLLRADQLIDSEKYPEAAKVLTHVLDVNPRESRAWAYRAVLAHLSNDPTGETSARASASERWKANPEIDHLIGKKLSQKYRFAEGSAYQKKALALDADYLPAKVQLCTDLLRLGDETEGWALAAEIFAKDAYNVVAFNLITLRDRLATFRTLEGDGFLVRMDPREADLYGSRVLDLLKKAKTTLGASYGVLVEGPVTVEIFPQKKEFAVRTFGLPGADGLLGVCFGRVITANSPASQGETPTNWESVLWHEYCHVLTLTKTHNKMPRWLSEGISVYEEGRRDPAWATPLSPQFRKMILGDSLTPLSKLSAAFLGAESALHLQFAYFESALAVEFLVNRAGLPALKGVLDDLGAGKSINEALPARTKMTLVDLDKEFAKFAHARAESIAPGATWEDADLDPDADVKTISTWLDAHPKSFSGQRRLAARLVVDRKWDEAKVALTKLKSLYPEYVGPENAYVLLAAVHKALKETKDERAVLEELCARDGNASPAYLRLIEIDGSARDWKSVAVNARRLLAVNPLIAAPHRALALASEELGDRDEAIVGYRAVSLIDNSDPAGTHFRLARLLSQAGKPVEARREVLKALEDAPRFVEAHKLLLELVGPDKDGHAH